MTSDAPTKRCKHCGQWIEKYHYGAGWRWEHTAYLGTGWFRDGAECVATTKAEPKE